MTSRGSSMPYCSRSCREPTISPRFAVAALFVDVDVAVDELSEILVGRHHADLPETLSGGFAGERVPITSSAFAAGDLEAGRDAHRSRGCV